MKLKAVLSMYLVLLLIAIAITGCSTKGLNYEAGLRKFEAKELDEALKIFEEIVQAESGYTNRARYYIGECYKLKFNWAEATRNFQMVADAEPPTSYLGAQARNRIAQIREGRKDIERLEIIIGNYPDQAPDAMLELGSVYENKLDDYGNAIKTYRKLAEKYPGTAKAAQAQINIGYVYFYKLYDYIGGWPEFRKVNEENYPNLKYRVSEVEDLLRSVNNIRDEIAEHQAFIRDSQKRKITKNRRISGYELYGAKEEQVAQSFLAVGKKWRALKNYPKSIEAYQMLIDRLVLKLNQVAEARFAVAEIYQDQGRYFEAIDAYEEFVKYHPSYFRREEVIYDMAICYESLRQYNKAYEYYQTYTMTYPEGKLYKAADLKVRQYEYDEDQDGFPYYKELASGTSDTDPNQHP